MATSKKSPTKKPAKKKVIPKGRKGGEKAKNKGGRPTVYSAKMNKIVYKLALLGAKNTQIADSLGITNVTFYDWLKNNEQFSYSLKQGREEADSAVVHNMFRLATGYSTTETDIKVINGEIVKTTVKKNFAPNVTSQIFWLKNRQPDLWKDKQEVLQSGEIGVKVEDVTPKLDALSDDDKLKWLELQKKLRK